MQVKNLFLMRVQEKTPVGSDVLTLIITANEGPAKKGN